MTSAVTLKTPKSHALTGMKTDSYLKFNHSFSNIGFDQNIIVIVILCIIVIFIIIIIWQRLKLKKNRMYVPPRGNILLDSDAYMIPMTSKGNSNDEEEDTLYESVHSLGQS